jgi:uncharacterized protein (TIGR02246 family)
MSAEEQAIRDVIANWAKATADGDIPALLTLMAEDVMFLMDGQPPMTLKGFVERFTKMRETHRIGVVPDIKEVMVSGNLAYSWSQLTVTLIPLAEGAPVGVRTNQALSIYHKQANGAWVLIRDANLTA